LQFISNIDNSVILNRDDMMKAIESAQFDDQMDQLKQKIHQTADYIDDDKSSKTRTEGIRMCHLKRSQLVGTDDEMQVKLLKLPLHELAKKYLAKNEHIEDFLDEETKIVTKIRVALTWLSQNVGTIQEITVQKIFTLYCSGLLKKVNGEFEIYAINSVPLEAKIETINVHNDRCITSLFGKADVAIGKKLTDGFDSFDLQKLKHVTSVIGEMKRCFGSLYLCKSVIGKSTDQLLVEMLGLSKMRRSNKFTKGFLTDFFYFRMAFRCVDAGSIFYYISSLYETAREFVLSIIILISGISVSDVCKLQSFPINEDEEEEQVDENANIKENDDKDITRGEKLSYKNNKVNINRRNNNNSSYSTKRHPLKTRNCNIIYMGNDTDEEREDDLKHLAEWEAARLGRVYLNSHNLNLIANRASIVEI
jgi:hypothetical protein